MSYRGAEEELHDDVQLPPPPWPNLHLYYNCHFQSLVCLHRDLNGWVKYCYDHSMYCVMKGQLLCADVGCSVCLFVHRVADCGGRCIQCSVSTYILLFTSGPYRVLIVVRRQVVISQLR